MPQFDFSTYLSQIFWFSICFILLYLFISLIILPRIKSIFELRSTIISQDNKAFEKLDQEIHKIRQESDDITRNAEAQYKSLLEKSVKEAALNREKSLEEFKENSEKIIKDSQKNLQKLVDDSQKNNELAAKKLAELIDKKILN